MPNFLFCQTQPSSACLIYVQRSTCFLFFSGLPELKKTSDSVSVEVQSRGKVKKSRSGKIPNSLNVRMEICERYNFKFSSEAKSLNKVKPLLFFSMQPFTLLCDSKLRNVSILLSGGQGKVKKKKNQI